MNDNIDEVIHINSEWVTLITSRHPNSNGARSANYLSGRIEVTLTSASGRRKAQRFAEKLLGQVLLAEVTAKRRKQEHGY